MIGEWKDFYPYPYPENLVRMLQARFSANGLTFTYDAVYAMLDDLLKEREKQVVEYRWRDGETYDRIGKRFGLSRERVRQIEAFALRKLARGDAARRYASVPYARYAEAIEKIGLLEKRLERLEKQAKEERLQETLKMCMAPPENETSLESLDLSVRSYNALSRAGYTTVEDVLGIPNRETLLYIRNLGRKSADEICEAIHCRGLKMKWEQNTDGLQCPYGGDETNDCAGCAYSADYHLADGECRAR